MTNHPGDYYSFLTLTRLREEELGRKARRRDLLTQVDYSPGLRASIAGFLRRAADRVDTRSTATERQPSHRYQRAP
jgi:hypothetical protein